MKECRHQLQDALVAADRMLKDWLGLVRGKCNGRDRPTTVPNRNRESTTDAEFRCFVEEPNLIFARCHAIGAEPSSERFRLLVREHDDGIKSFVATPESVLRPADRI
jgi:hypothetical protein